MLVAFSDFSIVETCLVVAAVGDVLVGDSGFCETSAFELELFGFETFLAVVVVETITVVEGFAVVLTLVLSLCLETVVFCLPVGLALLFVLACKSVGSALVVVVAVVFVVVFEDEVWFLVEFPPLKCVKSSFSATSREEIMCVSAGSSSIPCTL